jgi:hypothetical protein
VLWATGSRAGFETLTIWPAEIEGLRPTTGRTGCRRAADQRVGQSHKTIGTAWRWNIAYIDHTLNIIAPITRKFFTEKQGPGGEICGFVAAIVVCDGASARLAIVFGLWLQYAPDVALLLHRHSLDGVFNEVRHHKEQGSRRAHGRENKKARKREQGRENNKEGNAVAAAALDRRQKRSAPGRCNHTIKIAIPNKKYRIKIATKK